MNIDLSKIKKTIKIMVLCFIGLLFLIYLFDTIVALKAKNYLYNTTDSIPYNSVGVILGASKNFTSGERNQYFDNRIAAGVSLYKAKKVSYFVVSGDHNRPEYNEPQDMKQALVDNGIPENHIYLDYAGFRTLDSIVRMDKIFNQSSFTIISQKFHLERALYISTSKGLNTVGFVADDVELPMSYKVNDFLREKVARVKMLIDLVVNKQPKFLGDPISIGGKIDLLDIPLGKYKYQTNEKKDTCSFDIKNIDKNRLVFDDFFCFHEISIDKDGNPVASIGEISSQSIGFKPEAKIENNIAKFSYHEGIDSCDLDFIFIDLQTIRIKQNSCTGQGAGIHFSGVYSREENNLDLLSSKINITDDFTKNILNTYIKNTQNKLVSLNRDVDKAYFDRTETYNSIVYDVYYIGHTEMEPDGSNPRSIHDAWVYIDTKTQQLYEVVFDNDSIKLVLFQPLNKK